MSSNDFTLSKRSAELRVLAAAKTFVNGPSDSTEDVLRGAVYDLLRFERDEDSSPIDTRQLFPPLTRK